MQRPLLLTGLLFLAVVAAVGYLPVRRYLDRVEVERVRALPRPAEAAPSAAVTPLPVGNAPAVPTSAPATASTLPLSTVGDSCTLRFTVRDAASGEVLPEVEYRLNGGDEATAITTVAPGEYDFVLPLDVSYGYYEIGAPGYATKAWRLDGAVVRTGAIVPISVMLDTPWSMSGQVNDVDGRPVPDTQVTLYAKPPWEKDRYRVNYQGITHTDPSGHWRLIDIPADCTGDSLLLAHPEYVSDARRKRSLALMDGAERVDVLEKGRPFQGRVVDPQGVGIGGASLDFRGLSEVHAETNDAGAFTFPHISEDYFEDVKLAVKAPGYGTVYSFPRPSDWTDDFQVVLSPCVPQWIQFLDQRGRPLANARAFISFENATGRQVDWKEFRSGEDGAITLEDVPPAVTCRFSAGYPNGQWYRNPERMILPVDGTPMHVRLRLVPKVTILAKDAATGQPLEQFYVTQGSAHEDSHERPWWQRMVEWRNEPPEIYWDDHSWESASRIFERPFDGHAERPIYYRVEAPGYWPRQTPVFTGRGDDAYFVVALQRGDAPRILPVDAAGQPVLGARAAWVSAVDGIRIHRGRPRSTSALWALDDAEAGWLQLQPVDASTQALVVISDYGMAIEAGQAVRPEAHITLVPWGRLEGTLGAPAAQMAEGGVRVLQRVTMAGLTVHFEANDPNPSGTQFTLDRLYPGTYWVAPEAWPSDEARSYYAVLPWTSVPVAAGETATVSLTGGRAVRLQLDLAPAQLAWIRKSPTFLPLVREDGPEEWRDALAYLKTGPAGEATIAALPPGKYALRDAFLLDPDQPADQAIRRWLEPVQFEIADDPATHTTPLDLGVVKVAERRPQY